MAVETTNFVDRPALGASAANMTVTEWFRLQSPDSLVYTFTVDDLNIDESVDGGKTVTFTHTISKAGTFRLYCIPHEAFGMEAEIVVE